MSVWTEATTAECKRLYIDEGVSATETARRMGRAFTRNAVIGKAHRMGWTQVGRQRPSAPTKIPKKPAVLRHGPKPAAQNPFGASDPEVAKAKRAAQQMAGLLTIEAAAEGTGQNTVSLIERRFAQCSWPVGPDGQHLCCGDRIAATFRATPTYCDRHSRMAVARVQPARKPSVEPSRIRRAA